MKVYKVGLITTFYILQNSTKEIYLKKNFTHVYVYIQLNKKNYLNNNNVKNYKTMCLINYCLFTLTFK